MAVLQYTQSNKKVELAVKHVIEGKSVANENALRNPESLQFFTDLPELRGF